MKHIHIALPSNVKTSHIERALSEIAHRYGLKLHREQMHIPNGTRFEAVPRFNRAPEPRSA